MRRLDRYLCSTSFANLYDDMVVHHLPRATSNHAPLLLKCNFSRAQIPRPFRFINAWTTHIDYQAFLSSQWQLYPTVGGIRGLYNKLHRLKQALRTWNREIYGNIFSNVEQAEQEYSRCERLHDANPSPEHRESVSLAHAKLIQAQKSQTLYWEQKSRIKWMEEGEANTSYFHALVKDRHRKQVIRGLRNSDGTQLHTNAELGTAAVQFFTQLFTSETVQHLDSFLQHIPLVISQEDNAYLLAIPDATEIKNAVWSLSPNSAVGPDGFNGHFFRTSWSIIHLDVILAIQEFFLGIIPPQVMISSLITLIPKKQQPATYADFRPICLSNFISKVTTRILATRFSSVLHKVISPEQIGFLKGHDISKHVLMANDMVHLLERKVQGGNVMIKLDMAKAFDRVNWTYLESIMLRFGFHARLIRIIMNNMRHSKLSIAVNGINYGFFSPTRGVKQGDPLSPLLFLISSEGFSRGMQHLFATDSLRGFLAAVSQQSLTWHMRMIY